MGAKRRVVCIGNRFFEEDAAGPRVYDALSCRTLPVDVEIIDGGIGGLDLLRHADQTSHLVFVDSVQGFASPSLVVVLRPEDILENAPESYGHSSGLAFLLRALPLTSETELPRIHIVGIEGPVLPAAVEAAATLSLDLAGRS